MTDLKHALLKYRSTRLLGASAYDLLMMVYSEAISSCYKRNPVRASRALRTLQESLDPKSQVDLAKNLNRVYGHCMILISQNEYDAAADILTTVRNTWRDSYTQQ